MPQDGLQDHCGRTAFPIRASMCWCCGAMPVKGYSSPICMTFRQALELNAHVRKGERGSTVVYASKITRTGTDAETGEETQENIPFLKYYTVFNVEQIEGLPAHSMRLRSHGLTPCSGLSMRKVFSPQHAQIFATAAISPISISVPI